MACYNHAVKYLKSFKSKLCVQVYTHASVYMHKVSTCVSSKCFEHLLKFPRGS